MKWNGRMTAHLQPLMILRFPVGFQQIISSAKSTYIGEIDDGDEEIVIDTVDEVRSHASEGGGGITRLI